MYAVIYCLLKLHILIVYADITRLLIFSRLFNVSLQPIKEYRWGGLDFVDVLENAYCNIKGGVRHCLHISTIGTAKAPYLWNDPPSML